MKKEENEKETNLRKREINKKEFETIFKKNITCEIRNKITNLLMLMG